MTEHGHVYSPTPHDDQQAGVMNAGRWDTHRGMYLDCLQKVSVQALLRKVDGLMMGSVSGRRPMVSLRVELDNQPRNVVMTDSAGRKLPSGRGVSGLVVPSRVGPFPAWYGVWIQLKQRCWPAEGPAGPSLLIAELETPRALFNVCRPFSLEHMPVVRKVRRWLLEGEWSSGDVRLMRLRSHKATSKAVSDVNAQARRFTMQSMVQLSALIGPQHPRRQLSNVTVVMGWVVESTSRCWKHHCRIGHEHGVAQPEMVTLMEVALSQAGAVPLPAIGSETGLLYRIRITGRGAVAYMAEHPMGVSLSVGKRSGLPTSRGALGGRSSGWRAIPRGWAAPTCSV